MSRYEYKINGLPDMPEATNLAYGFDNLCGFFIQVFDQDEELLLDRDSMFHHLTGVELADYLEQFEIAVPQAHLASMYMDVQF